MNMILITINILIVSLLATKKSVFRSPAVLENENDPNRHTIYGEFIVFFDLDCVDNDNRDFDDIVQDFSNLFTCYELNEDVEDQYPDIIDHWIEMDAVENCNEPDVEIEWDDYCISGVEENEETETYGPNQCLSRPVESALWNLNTVCPAITNGIQFIQLDSTNNPNVDIIVMDTGIDASHPQFSGIRFERIYDAYSGQALHSHGSHCAGTILGKDYGALRVDSDTQIKLIDVRILDSRGSGSSTAVLGGYDSIINYLNSNPGKKVIINMSFGGGNWAEFNTRLASIRSKGGYSFAAAGNSNYPASWFSPASSADTITVGASDKSNNRASFSNYGASVDIWAPGVDIKSATVGGGTDEWDGTSMATPLVAGIAANILANNPSLDFNGIKQRLLSFAVNDVNDGRGNTNLPRVQTSCEEYGYVPTFSLRPASNYDNCLDVHPGQNDNLYVHPCHFGTNQKFKRGTPDSDGYYAIISLYNNECLDAHPEGNGVVDSDDNIYTHPCHNGDNQKWKIDGGIIRCKSNGRSQCLDFGDHNSNVHIWGCDYNNGNQRVDFEENTQIKSMYHSGKCLDVNYNSGNNVYLHPCHNGINQKWRRGTTDSDGYYTLMSEYNHECLDAHYNDNDFYSQNANDNLVNSGDNIYTHPCHNGDNQKWKIDGVLIKSKANGGNWCFDGGDYGLNAHIWDCNVNNGNQQFEYPGFSSLTGSYSSAWSIDDTVEMDDFEFMDKDGSINYFGKYLMEAIGVLLMINIVCFAIYFYKRNNRSKKGYRVVSIDSSTDIETPDQ